MRTLVVSTALALGIGIAAPVSAPAGVHRAVPSPIALYNGTFTVAYASPLNAPTNNPYASATPTWMNLACPTVKSCTVQGVGNSNQRFDTSSRGTGPIPLQSTAQLPPIDDGCPVPTTVTSDLRARGKKRVNGGLFPASVSGTIVVSWPLGGNLPPCGGQTWTYTFTDAAPQKRSAL